MIEMCVKEGVNIMAECKHPMTTSKTNRKGYWCILCGVRVVDVEEEKCGDCAHYIEIMGNGQCFHHKQAVHKDTHMVYYVNVGSCWTRPMRLHQY